MSDPFEGYSTEVIKEAIGWWEKVAARFQAHLPDFGLCAEANDVFRVALWLDQAYSYNEEIATSHLWPIRKREACPCEGCKQDMPGEKADELRAALALKFAKDCQDEINRRNV